MPPMRRAPRLHAGMAAGFLLSRGAPPPLADASHAARSALACWHGRRRFGSCAERISAEAAAEAAVDRNAAAAVVVAVEAAARETPPCEASAPPAALVFQGRSSMRV